MIIRAALTGALLFFDFGLARAADISAGLTSARTLCMNCHIVESNAASQKIVTDGIPSFKAIAEARGQTQAKLRAFMLAPHPPMPRVQLTIHELNNLASYIMSLRGQR